MLVMRELMKPDFEEFKQSFWHASLADRNFMDFLEHHMSSVQNLCWLMIRVDYTTQYVGDDNKLIQGSL